MRYVLFFTLFTTFFLSDAAVITSKSGSGDWNNSSSWVGGVVPSSGDDVIIDGSITLTTNQTCHKLTINSGKVLTINPGQVLTVNYSQYAIPVTNSGTLTFAAGGGNKLTIQCSNYITAMHNSGTFNSGTGTVELIGSGTNELTVSGTLSFYNLYGSASKMNTGSNVTISNALRLSNGSYLTAHPTYAANATLEINASITVNGNYHLWPSGNGSNVPPNIRVLSGSVLVEGIDLYLKKSISVSAGATFNLAKVCISISSSFVNFYKTGDLILGGLSVLNGAVWDVNNHYTLSTLKIENGGVVNANSYSLTLNAARNNCNINGIMEVITGGTFNPGTGTVIFNPPFWLDLNSSNVNGGTTFNNVVINGPGTVNIPTSNIVTVNGNMSINNGGTVNQPNNINFGQSATVTNNGATSNGSIPPEVPTTTTTPLSGDSGGGAYNHSVSITGPTVYTLTSNLQISGGTRNVIIVSPGAELITGNYTIQCDTVYVYGKLTFSNLAGVSGVLLGATKLVIGVGSTMEYNAPSGTQTVTLRSDYSNLMLSGNAIKSFGAGTYVVKGNFVYSGGGPLLNSATVMTFNGDNDQSIAGLSYGEINIGGSGNKTLLDTTKTTKQIGFSGAPNLISNGLLILQSDAASTGSIGTLPPTATITGNVIVERYIPPMRKWRFLGIPLDGVTFQSWQNQIHITGNGTGGALGTTNSNGFDWTQSGSASVVWYNENSNLPYEQRWVSIPNTATAITPGRGYRIFVRGDRNLQGNILIDGSVYIPTAVTLRASGTIVKGTQNISLTCSNGCGVHDGWNLIANPYPSTIDWGNPAWETARGANISKTIYIYNPYMHQFASWHPIGGSVNGGSHYIASGQSFFVKVTGNQTLVFQESYKVNSGSTGLFGKSSSSSVPKFRVQLADTGLLDEAVVFFVNGASKGEDAFDGTKFSSVSGSISTYTAESNAKMTYNAMPVIADAGSDTIFLHTQLSNITWNYQLRFSELANMGSAFKIYLKDHFNNHVMLVNDQNATYTFATTQNVASSYAANRFVIYITSNQTLPVELMTFNAERKNKTVEIRWSTISEENSSLFEVEKSSDGVHFETLSVVRARGGLNKTVSYRVTDEQPLAATNYYRLKQIDQNGTFQYSNTVVVKANNDLNEDEFSATIEVYPIPAIDWLNIRCNEVSLINAKIELSDISGHIVLNDAYFDKNEWRLHVANLTPGVYFLSIWTAGRPNPLRAKIFIK